MKHSYAVTRILDHYPKLNCDAVVRRLRYSTFVNVERRYMYFEVPKAACSTMKELLHSLEHLAPIQFFVGDMWETRRDMFIHARENIALPSLVDLGSETQKQVLESDEFFRLTIVRNPYTRLASAWRNKVRLCEPGLEYIHLAVKGQLPETKKKSLLSFEEFVDYIAQEDLTSCDPHWRRQVDYLYFKALQFSHIGKVEKLEYSLQLFQQRLGLSDSFPCKRSNVSNSGYAKFTQSLADKIYSLYHEDFQAFGYNRDTWPAQREHGEDTSLERMIPEGKFNDEIIERNLIISYLYQERARLQAELQKKPSALLKRVWHRVARSFAGGNSIGIHKVYGNQRNYSNL